MLDEPVPPWRDLLEKFALQQGIDAHTMRRMIQEASFARVYASAYGHGTDGHLRLLLIALLTDMLDLYDGARLNEPASRDPQL